MLLQANVSAADDAHRLKCELVYMRDREEKLKQEASEIRQELQVRVAAVAVLVTPVHLKVATNAPESGRQCTWVL